MLSSIISEAWPASPGIPSSTNFNVTRQFPSGLDGAHWRQTCIVCVADKTIQSILRHANVDTTLTMYVKSVPADSHAAMQKLESVLKMGNVLGNELTGTNC